MKFIKWYLREYQPKRLLIEFISVVFICMILISPLVIYALLAVLEIHLWGTKWMAYMAVVLYYGFLISFVLYFPIKALLEIKQRYEREKRWEDGTQK